MTVYIPADLQRKIRMQFSSRCAYCQTPNESSIAGSKGWTLMVSHAFLADHRAAMLNEGTNQPIR